MDADHSHKFSPSKLDVYKDCPRRYRYRYVDRIKRDVKTVESLLGGCVHSALEALYESVQHGRVPVEGEALSAFDEAWGKGWSDAVVRHDERFSPEDWRALGRQCVSAYYRAHAPFDRDRTVAVERRVGFPVTVEGREYRIEGFVDRLALAQDGAFEVHDYKTGKTLPSQAEVDADWQLAIYDLAVRELWPDTKDVRLVWHYLRHGKSLVSSRDAAARQALLGGIAALIAEIKRDAEFAPKESPLCAWCEYRDLCPLFAHGEALAAAPPGAPEDSGAALVARLGALAGRKKELRAALKDLEREESAVEGEIAKFAVGAGVSVVYGEEGQAAVSEKEEYRFPTKTAEPERHEALETELKGSPLWPSVSQLDAHRLLEGYKRKAWPREWLDLAEAAIVRYAKRVRETTVRYRRRKEAEDD